MKTVSMVGESLPLRDDGSEYKVTACGQLGSQLETFDSRHGVFCNFVMTPLLASIHALTQQEADVEPLCGQLEDILKDGSERRFNVFGKKKKGKDEAFVIDANLASRVREFDPTRQLWLLFGYQTAFGLMAWLLDNQETTTWTRKRIEEVGFAFLTAASTHERLLKGWPKPVEVEPKTGHTGLLHRLCVEAEGAEMLKTAVETMAKPNADRDRILTIFRSLVPLLHNEGYRQANIGNVQVCFLNYATGKVGTTPSEQYWRVIGSAIACRLREQYVNR
ncbi:MAG: hypothetical protein K1X57_10910 [Gemmataceae bacterium]|nr:hypothetical protein [Gemmataceae bacterium]